MNQYKQTWWGTVIVLAKSVICPRMRTSSSKCRCLSNIVFASPCVFITDEEVDSVNFVFFKWSIVSKTLILIKKN